MTAMIVFIFVLCALLILMACIKADRVRSWRESLNPSAPEIPDAGFTVARLILVALAVVGMIIAFQGITAQDSGGWSDEELTSAVEGATDALDGSFAHGVSLEVDTPADFGGTYARKVEDAVVEHGGGDAPQFGVDAAVTGKTSERAQYRITASGAVASFCMHVQRTHAGYIETVVPGIPGDAGVVKRPKYTFEVSSRAGEC
ncbi:hypothetical protein [Streptomyces sp. DSM 40484]|uniref:hypothetical protein n=1 Tax=Streptomyces kroppenstedtii TaxID=3051181 RepID=UPI0028D095CA|nr:hypothetical protein [Streptomyces sp. DSM 40484]